MMDDQDIKIQLGDDPIEQQKSMPKVNQPISQPNQDNSGNVITNLLKSANHPAVCIIHVAFRFSAFLW